MSVFRFVRSSLLTGLLLTLVLILAVPALAQDTAILTGRVEDPSGAVVAGAHVTVLNIATNMETASETNGDGLYHMPSLRPGIYRVTISATGFKKFVREDVELTVAAVLPIDARLEVGAASDTVEVTAATPLLETETSTTDTMMEGDFFYRMPNYQRNARGAMIMTPDVQLSGAAWPGSLGNFAINGEGSRNIGYFEDGMYGVSPNNNGMSTDTIENTIAEVKVLTSALPAEYGHSASGAITVAKKFGTNELHGLASEYGRVGAMQERYFFQEYTDSAPPPNGQSELFQEPDANLSGPVYIPKVYDGRNKTFFLVAVQRMIEKQGFGSVYTVPTPGELTGNFSYPEAPAGTVVYPIFDPRTTLLSNGVWSRQPFPNNIIPQNQFDPVAKKFLSLNPWTLPNTTPTWSTGTGATNNLMLEPDRQTYYENFSMRLDQQMSEKWRIYGNWTYNSRVQITPAVNIANPILDSSRDKNETYQNTTGLGSTYVISPTLISETRFNYYRMSNPVNSIAYGTNWGTLLGIPDIGVTSMPNGLPIYVGNPSVNVQETFDFKEDLSKAMGRHAFKMGYDLMRVRSNSYSVTNDAGTFSLMGTNGLNANGVATPGTGGDAMSAFLVGAVGSYSVSTNLVTVLPRDWIHSLYFQDDWKVSPSFTANIGLRWQVESTPNNKWGQESNFSPTTADNTDIGFMGCVIHPTGSMYNRRWHNFQPRAGFAWNVANNWVVRGGFALNTIDNRAVAPPTNEYGSITATETQPSGNYYPLFQLSQGPTLPLPWPTIRSNGSIPFSGTNYSSRSVTWVNPNLPNPYTMNWNLSVQRALKSNYLLELTYNGDRSLKGSESWAENDLPYSWAWNLYQTNPTAFSTFTGNTQPYRPFVNFGGITYQGYGANAIYHAGTIKVQKRYSYGLTLLAFYTRSKDLSESTSSLYLARNLDRGRTGNDRKHQFTSSMTYELPVGKGRRFMNRGGLLNTLFGGYDMVWQYQILSGNPLTFGMTGTLPLYMPGVVDTRGGRPNSTGVTAALRSDWQDIGGNRWVQSAQNKMINSMSDFTIPAAYTMGNTGKTTMDAQRFIAANFSAKKDFRISERLTFQFRYDYQNPFKWFNWGTPNTSVNFTSAVNTFGTVTPSTSSEAGTASNGGTPIQDITLALRF
jgi:hypothetical protein